MVPLSTKNMEVLIWNFALSEVRLVPCFAEEWNEVREKQWAYALCMPIL